MTLILLIRVALGLLLVVGGAMKLLDSKGFRSALEDYRVFSGFRPAVRDVVSRIVPPLESAAGITLATVVVPLWIAAAPSLPLLIGFTTAIWINAREGIEAECGCGLGQSSTSHVLVWRNVLMILLLGVSVGLRPTSTIFTSRETPGTTVTVYLSALLVAGLLAYAPALIEEFRHQLTHVRT